MATRNTNRTVPVKPKEAKPADIRLEAQQLSQSIFKSWITLYNILDKREDVIRKRWMKKSKDQRARVLQAAWPTLVEEDVEMPVSHRPDFELFLRPRSNQPIPRAHFKWPYINLDDLTQGRYLLLLLNARGRQLPEVFAHSDLQATHIGQVTQVLTPQLLDKHTMFLTGRTTPNDYGQLVSWEEDSDALFALTNKTQFAPGHGLMVLQMQDNLYKFLVEACYQMFLDLPSRGAVLDESLPSQPEPPEMADDTSYAQTLTSQMETQYRVPSTLDVRRILNLTTARLQSQIDHVINLRSDPEYFRATVEEMADHRQERLDDLTGELHPHDGDDVFYDRVMKGLIMDCYGALVVFGKLHERALAVFKAAPAADEEDGSNGMEKIDLKNPLSKELESALLDLRFTIRRNVNGPIQVLMTGAPGSPPLRQFFRRTKKEGGDGKVSIQSTKEAGGERLITILDRIWNRDFLFALRLSNLTDAFQSYLEDGNNNKENKEKVSPWVARAFGDLSLFSQLGQQIDSFYPWSAGFTAKLDLSDKERGAAYLEEMKAFTDLDATIKGGIELAKVGTPLEKKFCVGDVKDKEKQQQMMKQAEENLDEFWEVFDEAYEKQVGKPFQDVLEPFGIDLEDLWRPSSGGNPYAAAPTADSVTVVVTKRAHKVFTTMFSDPTALSSPEEEAALGDIAWPDFLHALTSIGFAAEKRYGTVWLFTPTEKLLLQVAKDKEDKEWGILFHEPHPSGKIPKAVARRWGRRLSRGYGLGGEGWCKMAKGEN